MIISFLINSENEMSSLDPFQLGQCSGDTGGRACLP